MIKLYACSWWHYTTWPTLWTYCCLKDWLYQKVQIFKKESDFVDISCSPYKFVIFCGYVSSVSTILQNDVPAWYRRSELCLVTLDNRASDRKPFIMNYLWVRLTRYQGVLGQWSFVTCLRKKPAAWSNDWNLNPRLSYMGSNERCFLTFSENHGKSHINW